MTPEQTLGRPGTTRDDPAQTHCFARASPSGYHNDGVVIAVRNAGPGRMAGSAQPLPAESRV